MKEMPEAFMLFVRICRWSCTDDINMLIALNFRRDIHFFCQDILEL